MRRHICCFSFQPNVPQHCRYGGSTTEVLPIQTYADIYIPNRAQANEIPITST